MSQDNKTKALVLFSGGLDSMLAIKLLQNQGVKVTALTFESGFFSAEKARESVPLLDVEHRVIDISDEELALVKNPPSGYGKNLNPCIDCHSLMIKKAGEIAQAEGYAIIATGEVLGQRPFSQNKSAMARVRKSSGVDVLRPLSAKLLGETEAEKNGLVTRGKLEAIRGRTRERQMELAAKFGIENYPSPAGGCLLTDPEFSDRLGKMLGFWPECMAADAALLKFGRVFWFKLPEGRNALLVVGRNDPDNQKLEKLAKPGDYMLELKEITGPTAILRFKSVDLKLNLDSLKSIKIPDNLKMSSLKLGEEKDFNDIIMLAALLTGYYSTKARGKEVYLGIKEVS